MTQRIFSTLAIASSMLLSTSSVNAQTVVAGEDFDGGSLNVISGFDATTQNETILPFTRFGIFELSEFAAINPAPFALVDDSVADISSGGDGKAFPADSEGIFGVNRDVNDAFFCAVSADGFNFPPEELMGSWTFDVSSADGELSLSIDMGQMSNDSFDGVNDTNFVLFEYSFDGAPFSEAISVLPAELVGSGFMYRLMDNGDNSDIDFDADGTHNGTRASGPNTVTKTLVDTGAVDTDTILNRTPSEGAGAGMLDNYSTPLTGSGNTLEIRVSVDFAFEAFAFDNLQITTADTKKGIPGDVNCDGIVDLLDVAPFVDAVSNSVLDPKADVNGDGSDDLLDVAPFVELLTGG